MTQSATRLPLFSAAAEMDVIALELWVDRTELTRALRNLFVETRGSIADTGFALVDTQRATAILHRVVIELWRIKRGWMQPAGVEQDVWYRSAGGVLGAWLGAALAPAWRTGTASRRERSIPATPIAATPGATDVWSRSVEDSLQGAVRGAALGTEAALRISRNAQARWGNYEEFVVLVPDVHVPSLPENPVTWVASMYTDSAFARWIDRAFGYGLSKGAARVTREADTYTLHTDDTAPSFHAAFASVTADESAPDETPDYWSQPLLGRLPSGAHVLSRFDRRSSLSASGLRGELALSAHCTSVLPSTRCAIRAPVANRRAPAADGSASACVGTRFPCVHGVLYPPRWFRPHA